MTLGEAIRRETVAMAQRVAAAAADRTGLVFHVESDAGGVSVVCRDPKASVLEYGTGKEASRPWADESIREGAGVVG